ncbi:hypothetical protein F4778DRAFT_239328 [Xylariomycetidae sp. FL2044]|nr:hypothetical protein F4778DRAFT_239328 [Xylariomycetidae sp. FL2044]
MAAVDKTQKWEPNLLRKQFVDPRKLLPELEKTFTKDGYRLVLSKALSDFYIIMTPEKLPDRIEIRTSHLPTSQPKTSSKPEKQRGPLVREPSDALRPPRDVSRQARDVSRQPSDALRPPRDVSRQPRDVSRQPRDVSRQPSDASRKPRDLSRQSSCVSIPPRDLSRQSRDLTKKNSVLETQESRERADVDPKPVVRRPTLESLAGKSFEASVHVLRAIRRFAMPKKNARVTA